MSVSFSHFSSGTGLPLTARSFPVATNNIYTVSNGHFVLYGGAASICRRFCGLKLWLAESLNLKHWNRKYRPVDELKIIKNQDKDELSSHLETSLSNEGQSSKGVPTTHVPIGSTEEARTTSHIQTYPLNYPVEGGRAPSLCIAVIGATGELARSKIFPALFALYYSGFLPENVGIFGYSRKDLTDEDLRSVIASTLTCRIDHQENCGDKMDAFLSRTYYLNGGYDNREGMIKLNALMEHIELIYLRRVLKQTGYFT